MNLIDIPDFIKTHITKREKSLLEMDMKKYALQLQNAIEGKSVMVIGGAGTIGLAFIKELLAFRPERLYVVDINENGLTEVTRDLRSTKGQFIPDDYKTYPMNFGDDVFRRMYENEGPFDIVANFAAHKHVRSEKDHYAIEAMIDNNIFKTRDLLQLLNSHPPAHFFCVSTDKAVNPVNVMGASKKLMEEVIMAYSGTLKISTARFANVAFSNGSLLDGYIQRILKKQPISCPDDVMRFFVSPEESGQICLMACILGKSGEIFFPKLSERDLINFKKITKDFFAAMGLEIIECQSEDEAKNMTKDISHPKKYPAYFFSSATSGEKLYEEFYSTDDIIDLDTFHGLGVIRNAPRYTISEADSWILELKKLLHDPDANKASIVSGIQKLIPNFTHIETGLNLDQKM